jgi:hypothetical protein
VDVLLLEVSILENLFDGLESLAEEVNVDLLELGAGKSLVEVVAILEGFIFETEALLGGQSPPGLFDFYIRERRR